MSGHNKWCQIKRQKEKTDAKKSQIFSKMAKMISVEAKLAGSNRDAPGLKSAIEKARAANVPNDNIERAIKKASESGAGMETITYEAYGPGGVAMIIECLTNNRNKAAQEVKFILSKYGSGLGGIGSVTWAFEKNHSGWVPKTTMPLENTDLENLEKLVDELEANEEVQEVYTNAE